MGEKFGGRSWQIVNKTVETWRRRWSPLPPDLVTERAVFGLLLQEYEKSSAYIYPARNAGPAAWEMRVYSGTKPLHTVSATASRGCNLDQRRASWPQAAAEPPCSLPERAVKHQNLLATQCCRSYYCPKFPRFRKKSFKKQLVRCRVQPLNTLRSGKEDFRESSCCDNFFTALRREGEAPLPDHKMRHWYWNCCFKRRLLLPETPVAWNEEILVRIIYVYKILRSVKEHLPTEIKCFSQWLIFAINIPPANLISRSDCLNGTKSLEAESLSSSRAA